MNKILFFTGLLSLFVFSDCKKGPDDPFISLRSRKARVAGDWKMTKGSNSSSSSNKSNSSSGESIYNGTSYTTNKTSTSAGATTEIGTYSLKMSFKKDGTFEYEEILDGDLSKFIGTWNFTGGIGDKKNKEQIVLHGTSSSSNNYNSLMTGNQIDVTFDLKELRNKKMVFTLEQNNSEVMTNGDVNTNSFKAEYTLEQ